MTTTINTNRRNKNSNRTENYTDAPRSERGTMSIIMSIFHMMYICYERDKNAALLDHILIAVNAASIWMDLCVIVLGRRYEWLHWPFVASENITIVAVAWGRGSLWIGLVWIILLPFKYFGYYI